MAQWASGSKQHLGLGLLRTWVGLGTSSNPLSPTLPEIGQGPLTLTAVLFFAHSNHQAEPGGQGLRAQAVEKPRWLALQAQ